MKEKTWKIYAGWILLTVAVGALSGWMTRDGIRAFQETVVQPALTPPAVVFPIVWGILYTLMGISAARISLAPPSAAQKRGLNLFFLQLAVNYCWSPIFFNAQAYGFALVWLAALWALVLWMIFTFRKTDRAAALLQIPYLLWLTLAAWLNYGVRMLNR